MESQGDWRVAECNSVIRQIENVRHEESGRESHESHYSHVVERDLALFSGIFREIRGARRRDRQSQALN
jgi:hypothetical protein